MKRITHPTHLVKTLSWLDDSVIDWASSTTRYYASGERKDVFIHQAYAYLFDIAIASEDGVYALIFYKRGTKGLLLKNGQLLREVNRSYYQADVYEYPACFASLSDGNTYLVHCPLEYNRIDLENVETGEIITNHADRKPSDFFHSRFLVSPDNSKLISRGWAWHPADDVELFDLELALKDPLCLDNGRSCPNSSTDLSCASFIDNKQILVAAHQDAPSSPYEVASHKIIPGSVAVWNIEENTTSQPVKLNFPIDANLYAINDHLAWDLHDYPKIINFKTGMIIDECREISSGQQFSSIIGDDELPPIAFNSKTKQVAIYTPGVIDILTHD